MLVRRTLTEKLNKLQEALDERKLAFVTLSAKHTTLEADLADSRRQYGDVQTDMKRLEIDTEERIQKIRRECKHEKDVGIECRVLSVTSLTFV